MKLLAACFGWIRTKPGIVGVVVGSVCLLLLGHSLLTMTFATIVSVVSLLGGLACLLPCLIPLFLLRGKKKASEIRQTEGKK